MAEFFQGPAPQQAEFDALNGNITKLSSATEEGINSLDSFKSKILAVANAMSNRETRVVHYYASATFAPFVTGVNYYGHISVVYKSGGNISFTAFLSSQRKTVISVGYDNGTWYIEELALNSKIAK